VFTGRPAQYHVLKVVAAGALPVTGHISAVLTTPQFEQLRTSPGTVMAFPCNSGAGYKCCYPLCYVKEVPMNLSQGALNVLRAVYMIISEKLR